MIIILLAQTPEFSERDRPGNSQETHNLVLIYSDVPEETHYRKLQVLHSANILCTLQSRQGQ